MTSASTVVTPGASAGLGRTGWRLAAIVVFLGLPLAAGGVAGIAITEGLDASQVADHADATALTIIHQLDRRAAAQQQPLDTTARYLTSANASLARAELQALAGRLIEGGGGRVIELQSTDANEPDPANHVSVDVTFDTNNAGLLDILYGAETGLPLLTVPRIEARSDAAEGQAGSGQLLRVTMTVQGSWRAVTP